jgi:hypothetical protein
MRSEANEKARLELKASTSDFCTSKPFGAIIPPSLRYISKACEGRRLSRGSRTGLASGGRRPFRFIFSVLLPFKRADDYCLLF